MEQDRFRAFVQKLVDLDGGAGRIPDLVWLEFSRSIRLLLDNEYVHQGYWEFQRGRLTEEQWRTSFARAKKTVVHALDFLAKFVPVLVETMMDHPEALWGDASYPVVDG